MRASLLLIGVLACGGSGADDSTNLEAGTDATNDVAQQHDTSTVADSQTSDASDAASDQQSGAGIPPFGGSSGGSGGVTGQTANVSVGSVDYEIVVPANPAKPCPLLIVYSGTEGGAAMTDNLISVGPSTGTDGFIRAVLDGVFYNGNGAAGASVLDDVRSHYDIDNDRTYLLSESAGTTAGFSLGFNLRESYFAAYWVNDVNATSTPSQTSSQIGFQPWGQVGPGGDTGDANTIIAGMKTASYRVPNPAPYNGTGSNTHGDPTQFIAAVSFFPGKSRQ